MSEPLRRPYPNGAIDSARLALRRRGHDSNTVRCAEGFNTPLWQEAIRPFLPSQTQLFPSLPNQERAA